MADVAKIFVLALVVPVLFALVHCGKAGCNTIVHTPQRYQGKTTALEPYIELGKLETRIWHCTSFTCSVAVTVKPWVHNPLGKPVNAIISCSFWNDDLKLDSRKLKPVLVSAQTSARVEIHHGVDILRQRGSVGVDCDADFESPGLARQPVALGYSDYASTEINPPAGTDEDARTDDPDDATELQDAAL